MANSENSKNVQSIEVMHRERLKGKLTIVIKTFNFVVNMILKIKPHGLTKKLIINILKFIHKKLYKILNKKIY